MEGTSDRSSPSGPGCHCRPVFRRPRRRVSCGSRSRQSVPPGVCRLPRQTLRGARHPPAHGRCLPPGCTLRALARCFQHIWLGTDGHNCGPSANPLALASSVCPAGRTRGFAFPSSARRRIPGSWRARAVGGASWPRRLANHSSHGHFTMRLCSGAGLLCTFRRTLPTSHARRRSTVLPRCLSRSSCRTSVSEKNSSGSLFALVVAAILYRHIRRAPPGGAIVANPPSGPA